VARWICLLLLLSGANAAHGARFNLVAEAGLMEPGQGEVSQALAWTPGPDATSGALALQWALEYGPGERFQVGFALPAVTTTWEGDQTSTDVAGMSAWGLFAAIPEERGPFGLTIGARVGESTTSLGSDLVCILERNLNTWLISYNAWLSLSWDRGDSRQRHWGSTQALGLSRHLGGGLAMGIELAAVTDLTHGASPRTHWHLGPCVTLERSRWWVTVTPAFKPGADGAEPDVDLMALAGVPF